MRCLRTLIPAVLLSCALPGAHAGAELLLQDGRILSGSAIERAPGLYLLERADGEVVPVPQELVRELRLTGADEPAPGGQRELRLTGADEPAPGGLREAEPETVAGYARLTLPVPSEQLAAFGGRRATFRRGPVDSTWRPTSDWNLDPRANEFHPARWARPPIDPVWTPVSAFLRSDDVTSFNPARWYRSSFGSVWRPRDGFGPTVWFPQVLDDEAE